MLTERRRMKLLKETKLSEYVGADAAEYEYMGSKTVLDSDGFTTDYTWYYDKTNDRHVFVFGDSDIYRPEQGDFDFECETEEEAQEWFDSYKGPGEPEIMDRDEIIDFCSHWTEGFSLRNGTLTFDHEEEAEMAQSVLLKYYGTVQIESQYYGGEDYWDVSYSDIITESSKIEEAAIDTKAMYKALLTINYEGGYSSRELENMVMELQPDAASMDDLTDDTIVNVYNELKQKYQDEIDRYGDDADIDYVALEALGLLDDFNESLNQREKAIYVDAVNEAEDLDDLKEIAHEIFWYDKSLFVKVNKFPKDATFEDVKANMLKYLQESLNESSLPYVKWVKKADSGKWVMWGGSNSAKLDPEFLNQINHPNFMNKEYNIENQYVDAMILPAGKDPADLDEAWTPDKSSLLAEIEDSDTKTAIDDFCSLPLEEISYKDIRKLTPTFWDLLSKIDKAVPYLKHDIEDEKLQRRFYNVWLPFANKCKQLASLKPGSSSDLKVAIFDANKVLERFPFGWKYSVDESFNESISLDYVVEPHKIDMDLYDIVFCNDHPHAGERAHSMRFDSYDDALKFIKRNAKYNNWVASPINEDTIKTKDGKWTNKGKEGTHGKFNTKKEADAQRKAMFANGFKENLSESYYKLCWYDSDPESGFYGDKFDCYAVVKAFDAKDAQEKFKDLLLRTGDEQDRDRIRYFKNFTDYLRDSEMYIDDATEEEYNDYKDYQEARFESLKESTSPFLTKQELKAIDDYVTHHLSTGYRYGSVDSATILDSNDSYKLVSADISYRTGDGEYEYVTEKFKLFADGSVEMITDESLKEDFSNFDLINYNDFLANNFDGWSDDIDYLIKDLNKVAKALGTSASKLVFYIDYDEDFWAADEIADVTLYLNNDYSIYKTKSSDVKFAALVPDNIWIFKNEQEANHVIDNVKTFIHEMDMAESLFTFRKFAEGLTDTHNDFIHARENWKQIYPDIDFDVALERWNDQSPMAEPLHWFAKPLYSAKAWEDMVQMFAPDIEHVEEEDSDLDGSELDSEQDQTEDTEEV